MIVEIIINYLSLYSCVKLYSTKFLTIIIQLIDVFRILFSTVELLVTTLNSKY